MARSPKNDPQEQTAYSWENSFTQHGKKLTEKEMRTAIKRATRIYRVPMVQLRCVSKDSRSRKKLMSYYDPNTHLISIRPRHMTLDVALHEAAHAIADWILGWDIEIHGPHWLGIYMTLLIKFKVLPQSALEATALERGLKWTPLWRVSPTRIRQVHSALFRRARFNHPEELIEWLAA